MIEQTLVLMKPDAVDRALVGELIKRFENTGLKIIGLKMLQINKEHSKKHYSQHTKKAFYNGLESFITSSPLIAMVLEGVSAINAARKIVGDTEPHKALPGTIRGDFAHHTYAYTDKKKIAIKNLVHASATVQEAKKEIKLWFKKNELQKYSTVHDKHVL